MADSATAPRQAPAEDMEALALLLGRPAESAERVGAGRNSRVYRVRAGGTDYAAKFYFRPTADGRDRLKVEFSGLQFLWRHGLRCIAEPLNALRERQVALYSFIDGSQVDPAQASERDIAQVLSFLAQLRSISEQPDARGLGSAAEAFFAAPAVLENLRQRLARLESLDAQGPAYDALRKFLRDRFQPALQRFGALAVAQGDAPELPWRYRTLSPSDLGFHNSLRLDSGQLVFLDFEYFGWDDPAKTLSDAMLHPLMRLPQERKRQLAEGFSAVFGADPGWRDRVSRLYPLFALKWCMIMLNEFRPEQIERRRYVDRNAEEVHVFQMRQLDAAQRLLESTVRAPNGFPYWG